MKSGVQMPQRSSNEFGRFKELKHNHLKRNRLAIYGEEVANRIAHFFLEIVCVFLVGL
jgi:hypothetical protein